MFAVPAVTGNGFIKTLHGRLKPIGFAWTAIIPGTTAVTKPPSAHAQPTPYAPQPTAESP